MAGATKGTEVVVTAYPECDLHNHLFHERGVEAHYDARTLNGTWGFMCDPCWRTFSSNRLGTGYGQRLVLAEPADDRPATRTQLAAIADRAMLIERECPGPYTRTTAKQEIARLDARIKELRADGILA